jgi:hypothetical protein
MSARYLSDVAGATAQHCWEILADGNLGEHFTWSQAAGKGWQPVLPGLLVVAR